MLTLTGESAARDCRGLARRDFLQAGTLGLGGLSLSWLLQQRALAGSTGADFLKDRSVVLVFLSGGASHIETFNPNMTAAAPYCSATGEVQTSVPGLTFGGTFPGLARHAHRMTVVRSFRHSIGDHVAAISHVLTGGTDATGKGTAGFSMGASYARMRGANHPENGLPTYCLLTSDEVDPQYRNERGRVERGSRPGTLGANFGPFDPGGKGAAVDNMRLHLDRTRLDDRRSLRSALDSARRDVDEAAAGDGLDKYTEQAYDVILGSAAEAFDLPRESPETLARYHTGRDRVGKKTFRTADIGRHLLTARRLVEAGCGFVTVHTAGWDMHADGNNPGIVAGMDMLGRPLDRALTAFLDDLSDRGLSDKVLLVVTGDFGRTPRINKSGGRDHWANLCTLAFAGGGMPGGHIVGQAARQNDVPLTEPVTVADLMTTVMHSLFDVGVLRVTRGVPRDLLTAAEAGRWIPDVG